jgi:beta-glucosidase
MESKIENVIESLTLEEKISILAGKDFWETVPIQSKGVPAIKVLISPLRGSTSTILTLPDI